uniref:Sulfotransferase domain-containing protein n=1 Tax=Graphocephala atropunctata TaxID=36148 RepID=A0A1B6KUA2_9HEMI
MNHNLSSSVLKTAKFLKKDLTNQQVATLCDHLSFEQMRDNPAVNNEDLEALSRRMGCSLGGKFIRSGQVGEGKKKLSQDWVRCFDQWSEENLCDTGLKF